MAEITVIRSYRYYDGWLSLDGGVYGNAGQGQGKNHTVIVQFTVSGIANNSLNQLDFTFRFNDSVHDSGDSGILNYAISTSMDNRDAYTMGNNNPTDNNRLTDVGIKQWEISGIIDTKDEEKNLRDLSITAKLSAGTYYLYFWGTSGVLCFTNYRKASITAKSAGLLDLTIPPVGTRIKWEHVEPLYINLNEVCKMRGKGTVVIPNGTGRSIISHITDLIDHINTNFPSANIEAPSTQTRLQSSLLATIFDKIKDINDGKI